MTLASGLQDNQLAAKKRKAAAPRRATSRPYRAGVVLAVLVSSGILFAACGGGPSSRGVASLGSTTTTGPSAAQRPSFARISANALTFASCMRAHGDRSVPDPVISGHHVSVNVNPGAPHFATAYSVCRHLLPNNGVPRGTITPAEQADYLKAATCMRSHGFPDFPDPVFQGDSVNFPVPSSVDTSSSRFKSAVLTCQKLIPAGLPYSSTKGS